MPTHLGLVVGVGTGNCCKMLWYVQCGLVMVAVPFEGHDHSPLLQSLLLQESVTLTGLRGAQAPQHVHFGPTTACRMIAVDLKGAEPHWGKH